LAQGSLAQRQAQVDYKAPFGDASAAVDQSTGVSAGRLGLTGALVAAGGGVFAANTIDDSFAVVNAGGLAGIPVLRENRLVGKTDADGQLLIPDLRAYQANAIAVDPLSLPLDAQAGQLDRVVRPADRSGVVVNFAVKRGGAARLKLVDTQGRLLPLGTMVTVEASGSSAPIGYDGTTYLTDLAVSNVVDVTLADGTACGASFAYTAKPGHIPLIGPITCR
jgi:outer membrane usher protein